MSSHTKLFAFTIVNKLRNLEFRSKILEFREKSFDLGSLKASEILTKTQLFENFDQDKTKNVPG